MFLVLLQHTHTIRTEDSGVMSVCGIDRHQGVLLCNNPSFRPPVALFTQIKMHR